MYYFCRPLSIKKMKIRINPPKSFEATIQLPSSKSISNRALIINALGNGNHQLENLSDCDDTQVMIRALHAQPGETIDIMAAGTAMRFLTAYLSVTSGHRIITGTQRMQQRPIQVLVNALRELGADIEDLDFISFEDLKDYEFNFNNDFCDDFDCFCCSYKDDCEYAMF